jgi:outer membrane lipoprotein LolB
VAAAGEGFNASLDWRQQGSRSELALRAPFGLRAADIRYDESGLRVAGADGIELRGNDADQLLRDSLGFAPPLRSLRYWLLGSSDPASVAEESLDDASRLQQLRQDGWQIDYESYQRAGRQWLPERIRLQRDAVRVRLVIGRWRLS